MEADFRNEFVRHPTSTKNNPALVLNADYRPLSYYPLSLWCWQDAVKAAFMERVDIVAEYDDYVNSPSISIKIPSVVVLKDYVRPQKKVAFTFLIFQYIFCISNYKFNVSFTALN